MKKYRKYTITPEKLITDEKLNWAEKGLMINIIKYHEIFSKSNPNYSFSNSFMMEKSFIKSKTSYKEYIKHLKQLGYIKDSKKFKHYVINWELLDTYDEPFVEIDNDVDTEPSTDNFVGYVNEIPETPSIEEEEEVATDVESTETAPESPSNNKNDKLYRTLDSIPGKAPFSLKLSVFQRMRNDKFKKYYDINKWIDEVYDEYDQQRKYYSLVWLSKVWSIAA